MRVAYLTFDAQGGMAHYAESLATAMQGLVNAQLVIVSPPDRVPHRARQSDVIVETLASNTVYRRAQKYNPLYYRRLARSICRQTQASIVHIISHSVGLRIFVDELNRRRVRAVYTVHDPRPHNEHRTLWGRVFQAYDSEIQIPRVLNTSAAVHVHSEKHKDELRRAYRVASPVYVVPHGAGATQDVLSGGSRPRELDGLDAGLKTLLFFGRIEPYKGLSLLIDTVRRLDAEGTGINLIIAGAGKLDCDVAGLRHCRVVVVNRFVLDNEIRAIFEASDAVVLPYTEATQSGVIPLAYSFGRPVIATRVGALDEIVVHDATGLLVAAGDARQLGAAIARLLSDDGARSRMGRAATLYADNHLSWNTVAALHMKNYEAALRACA